MTRLVARCGGWGLLAVVALLAGGCSSSVFGLVDDLSGGGNDSNVATAINDLSQAWLVRSYLGDETGAVTVPAAANLVWTFRNDMTFTVTAEQPVSVGGENLRVYDDAGTWAVTNAANRRMELTVTRRSGIPVAASQRTAVEGIWALEQRQLVIRTTALGPGDVRYVMTRQ